MNHRIRHCPAGVAGPFTLGVALLLSAPSGMEAFPAIEPGSPMPVFTFNQGGNLADYGWAVVRDDPVLYFRVYDGYVGAPPNDSAGDTSWIRSPAFTLIGPGGGDLSFQVARGEGLNPPVYTHEDQVPPSSVNWGFAGGVLRNVATGEFVWAAHRTGPGNDFQTHTFGEADLVALYDADPDAVYTFDLIDAHHGGWGGARMTNIVIPGTVVDQPVIPSPVVPALAIQHADDDQVRLSWPLATTGWTLQRAPEAGGQYTDAGLPVTVEGDENVAYDTIVSARQFYRLAE